MAEAALSLWQRLWYTRLRDALRGRFDASLDWRLVVAEAELPTELAEAVDRVVKRTRLWRREKVDVATELIAHFQDGLAAGRPPQQLIASFGDPQQAAQLIRRAKQRGRPLAWHVWRYGWMTIGVITAIYAVLAVYYLLGEISPTTNYLEVINRHAADVPEDQQAWSIYRRALLALGYRSDIVQPFRTTYQARPGDTQWPELQKFLEEHATSMADLREAAARGHFGCMVGFETQPEDYKLFGEFDMWEEHPGEAHPALNNALIPRVEAVRSAAHLLTADAERAMLADEWDTAYQDVVALTDMSRQLSEGPFLIVGLKALAIRDLAADQIEHVLAVRPDAWSDRQLVELAHRLGTLQPNIARWLEAEHVQMHDVIQRIFSDDGQGDGQITYAGLKWLNQRGSLLRKVDPQDEGKIRLVFGAGIPIAVGVMASRAETEQKFDELIAMAAADFQRPLWDERKRSASDELRRMEQSAWLRIKYTPIMIMMPAFQAVDMAVIRADARAEGVLVGIALELYHREHGAWPASLSELSPRYLPTVPIDRISGGPLGYRIVDDGPIVFSLGVDRDDDGGRLPIGEGEHPDAFYAGPTFWRNEPVTDVAHDGDWVIWSTVESR